MNSSVFHGSCQPRCHFAVYVGFLTKPLPLSVLLSTSEVAMFMSPVRAALMWAILVSFNHWIRWGGSKSQLQIAPKVIGAHPIISYDLG